MVIGGTDWSILLSDCMCDVRVSMKRGSRGEEMRDDSIACSSCCASCARNERLRLLRQATTAITTHLLPRMLDDVWRSGSACESHAASVAASRGEGETDGLEATERTAKERRLSRTHSLTAAAARECSVCSSAAAAASRGARVSGCSSSSSSSRSKGVERVRIPSPLVAFAPSLLSPASDTGFAARDRSCCSRRRHSFTRSCAKRPTDCLALA